MVLGSTATVASLLTLSEKDEQSLEESIPPGLMAFNQDLHKEQSAHYPF